MLGVEAAMLQVVSTDFTGVNVVKPNLETHLNKSSSYGWHLSGPLSLVLQPTAKVARKD